jgi:hypothetical protein
MKRFVTLLMLSLFAFASAYAQTVSVDDIYSNKGSEITIPIKLSNATSTAFTSGQFVLEYDTSIVEILSVVLGSVVTDPNAQLIPNNTVRAPGIGEYRVAISTTVPFSTEDGTLAVLTARVKNSGQSNLTLVNTLLNTNAPMSVQNGLLNTSIPITISGPSQLDQGATGTYSVSVGDLDARNISSFQFTIGFDSNLLNVASSSITNGAILDGLSTQSSVVGSAVRIAYGSQTALAGSGVLFTFEATASSSNTGTSTFGFSNVLFNTGNVNGLNTHVVTTPAFGVMVQDFVFVTLEGNELSRTLGGTSAIDIVASDLTGEGVFSYQFVLDYPENDVAIDSVVFLNDLNANNDGGIANIANGVVNGASGPQTVFAGAGSLVRIYVRNLTKGTHTLSFNSFSINTGTPIASTSTIDITVDNTAPTSTSILAPADGDTILVAGLPTTAFTPTWSAATDLEMDALSYIWLLNADSSFAAATELVRLVVNDTLAPLTLGAVDGVLAAAGLNVGDSVTVYHRADASDGSAITTGNFASVRLVRGVVNTPPTAATITIPFNATEITIQGDPSAPFTPRWSESTDADGDNVTYTWELSTMADFSNILVSVAGLTEERIELNNRAVADVLDAAGVAVGVPVTLYHRAQATDGKSTVNGIAKSVILTRGTLTNIGEELPVEFGLNQNYPNPFNPATTISYQVAESRMVSLKVYDMLGREVATLVNDVQTAGSYNISFDAARLSTGIYIYRMVSGGFVQTRKMTLMK